MWPAQISQCVSTHSAIIRMLTETKRKEVSARQRERKRREKNRVCI